MIYGMSRTEGSIVSGCVFVPDPGVGLFVGEGDAFGRPLRLPLELQIPL